MSSSHPLNAYLHELREIQSTGADVKETSYYGSLATALNNVGSSLKPRVETLSALELRSKSDVMIAQKILSFPRLGSELPGTWNFVAARELHMIYDGHFF